MYNSPLKQKILPLQKFDLMEKERYKFNPETLSYENKSNKKSDKIIRIVLSIIVPAIIIAGILIILLPYFAQNSRQKALFQEERILKENYNKLLKKKKIADQYLEEIKIKDKHIYREIFEAELQEVASKKQDIHKQLTQINPNKYAKNNAKILDSLLHETDKTIEATSLLEKIINSQKSELDYVPATQPIYNKNVNIPVYGFGTLIDPVYKTPAVHEGIDFAIPEGTPVFATANGKVSFSGLKRAKGMLVEIDHGNGYKSRYAHLSKIKVNQGKSVKRGELIAYSGNTGKSFIEHLHYEIQYKDTPINPINYFFLDLTIAQYTKMKENVLRAGISLD